MLATAWAYPTRCNTELAGAAHKECAQSDSPHKLHQHQQKPPHINRLSSTESLTAYNRSTDNTAAYKPWTSRLLSQ